MNAPDRRLAALTALFAADRARALLARLDDPGGPELAAAAETLAAAPRRDRLAALGAALGRPVRDDGWREVLTHERGPVAAVLAGIADRAGAPGASPVLVRLCLERLVPPG
jgi:hypothetical protein